jgi:recombination protein RecT
MDINEMQIARQAAAILAPGTSPERFAALAWQAIRKTPALAECSQESLLAAVMDCARLGLDPDGKLCTIVPRNKKKPNNGGWEKIACCDIGYTGYLAMADDAGFVIQSDVVYSDDDFAWSITNAGLEFRHNYGWSRSGEMLGAYAVASRGGQVVAHERMNAEEVGRCRSASKSPDGIWSGPFASEMWRKTAIRRMCKKLKLSPAFRDVENRTRDDDDKIMIEATPRPMLSGPDDLVAEEFKRLSENPQIPAEKRAAAIEYAAKGRAQMRQAIIRLNAILDEVTAAQLDADKEGLSHE